MSDDAQILANHLITLSIVDYDDVFVKSATELRRLDALVKEQAQEIERLRAQRDGLLEALQELMNVTPSKAPAADMVVDIESRHKAAIAQARAAIEAANIEAANKIIHPLQRLADLSKEIGEKL